MSQRATFVQSVAATVIGGGAAFLGSVPTSLTESASAASTGGFGCVVHTAQCATSSCGSYNYGEGSTKKSVCGDGAGCLATEVASCCW